MHPLARIGVVVVSYASERTLRACLTALPLQQLHGVVVVDNGSPDSSADVARSVDGVVVIEQENLGFGAGCNTGAEALPGGPTVTSTSTRVPTGSRRELGSGR